MSMQHSIQPKYTLPEAEQKTKPYLQNMPDDPGGLSYEELLEVIEGYYQRGETDQEELAKSYAGLGPDDEISEAVTILDELIDTDYYDAMSYVKETSKDESTLEPAHSVESLLDENINMDFEHVHNLYEQLESNQRHDRETPDDLGIQVDLLETLDGMAADRELKKFIKAWRRGEPLAKAWYRIEWIQEYCRTVFGILHPEEALKELIAIREYYGDENDDHYGSYRIGRMIAGCYAALGQFSEAKAELRSTAPESFQPMRRYTDFCLAFGFFEDVVDVLLSNMNRESFVRGQFFTEQLIIAHIKLGRIEQVLSLLRERLRLGSRNQVLVNNIWSLKLQLGLRPDGLELLSIPSASLRSFGKKNIQAVARQIDFLLESYEVAKQCRLLQLWSEGCDSWRIRSHLELISIPEFHDAPEKIETDVRRYDYSRCPSVQAFVKDLTRLAEDLVKSSPFPTSENRIEGASESQLLQIQAVRTPQSLAIKYELPSEFYREPIEFDVNYRPRKKSISRFMELSRLIPESYKKRNEETNAIDETIKLCREQIALSYDMAHYDHLMWRYTLAQRKRNSIYYENDPEHLKIYLDQAKQLRRSPCIAYERLAIILESRKENAEALRLVVQAKSEGQPGDWDKRIARLLTKMNK